MQRETPRKWREKQKIEWGKENPKGLDCFEMNCICSSLGEPEFSTFRRGGGE
jgi:hypothetical protein